MLKVEEEVTVHDFANMGVSACHCTASNSGCKTPNLGTTPGT